MSSQNPKKTKYIVIAGSIMSGLGKGIVTASIAKLLQLRDYKITPVKFDGYLNIDCGTMNPFRHGEVFVLDDGTEVDMDFGTYERFLNISLDKSSSITGGKLFQRIIEKERKGDYLGRDVQFIPHLTNEIKNWLKDVGEKNKADVVLIEVGGTVGDLENAYFLEALRQLSFEEPPVLFIQLSYVPSLSLGEQKTKPTQQATRLLQSMGIQPDIIICRAQEKLSEESKKKLSLYCNVKETSIFDDPLLKTVYELPLVLEKQNVYAPISDKLGLDKKREAGLTEWKKIINRITSPQGPALKIGIVGKYTAVKDAYVSVKEALVHSAASLDVGLGIVWIESLDLETGSSGRFMKDLDGIIVPGGFGKRGTEGKINAIKYARENKVPYLGLCLGMQLMVIEHARNLAGLKDANSTEFDKQTPHPVVLILPDKEKLLQMGGTLRLGEYICNLKKGTKAYSCYGGNQLIEKVGERHRHRYEINPEYVEKLESTGLVISGRHESQIVEIVEWKEGFGVASQAHLELKSRLEKPAPLFVGFLKAALEKNKAD